MCEVEYGHFDKLCTPNLIPNTDILITLGNTSAENLSVKSLTIISKLGFQTMFFISTLS